jgi:catecholate siderophore receptor
MNKRESYLTLLAALSSLGHPLFGQTPAPAPTPAPAGEEVVKLETFEVSEVPIEENIMPTSRPFSSVFGTDSNVMDTPRSVTIISSEQLSAISIKDVRDFSKLTSSSYTKTNFGAPGNPDIRGSYADVFQNGLRERATSNGNGLPLDFNAVESVNIVKGPATAVQGASSYVGGFVDLITKRPSFDSSGGSAYVTIGSYSTFRYGADYNIPVSDTVAMRFSYAGEDSDSYYNDMFTKSQSLYGALTWRPNDHYELFVNASGYYGNYTENWGTNRPTQALIDNGSYQTASVDNYTIAAGLSGSAYVDNNISIDQSGPIVQVNRHSKLSKPGDDSTGTNIKLQAIQTFKVSPDVTVTNNNLITYTKRETLSSYYYSEIIDPTITAQSKWDVEKKFADNVIIGGLDLKYQSTKSYSYYGYEPGNAWDITKDHNGIDATAAIAGATLVPGYSNRYYTSNDFGGDGGKSWGASVSPFTQTEIKLVDDLTLITGARAQFLHVYSEALDIGLKDEVDVVLPSVNASLVYKVNPKVSTYFTYNYSRNTAGAEANGGGYVLTETDGSGNRLGIDKKSYQTPAELFELGTKISLIENKLFLGLSAYYQTFYRNPPGGVETQIKNKGIEVDLNYQPNRNFFATFSYGYIDSTTEHATDLLDFSTYDNIRTQGLPQNQFNALASYTFNNGFGASINGTLASEINNNYAGTIVIPWQFEIDASVFYTYKDWNFKVAFLNLTDEENWAAPNGLYGSQSILAEEGFRTEFTVTYSF